MSGSPDPQPRPEPLRPLTDPPPRPGDEEDGFEEGDEDDETEP